MTAKAKATKVKKENTEIAKVSDGISSTFIPLGLINVSDFEPQVMRREHFRKEEDEELASSIRSQGLIQPIVVRPVTTGTGKKAEIRYEIVAGERRFRATNLTGAEVIEAFVRKISDDDAREVQMQENLQRKNVDPLSEAFSFKYLIEQNGLTTADVATKFGRTESLVLRRLKLNDLIPEALKDLADGFLPLGHAEEIALYPAEAQAEILKKYAYKWGDKNDGYEPLEKMKKRILENVVLHLPSAIFDKETEDLHPQGLACVSCDQRTGFMPKLFDTNITKDDHCLNKACFTEKHLNHVQMKKLEVGQMLVERVPEFRNLSPEELEEKIPLVSDTWLYGGKKFGDGDYKERQSLSDQPDCANSIPALVIGDKNFGNIAYICTDENCETHQSKDDDSGPSAWQLECEERSFNVKVVNAVREEIFATAMKTFNDSDTFWKYDDLIQQLLLLLWQRSYGVLDTVLRITKSWKEFPKQKSNTAQIQKFIASLNKEKQSQLLFLFTVGELGYSSYEPKNQDGVKKLMKEWTALDYELLDAQVRVKLAPKEFKSLAETHLQNLEKGEESEIPRFWWTAEAEAKFAEEDEDDEDDEDEDDEDLFEDDDDLDENDLGETTQG